AAVRLQLDTGNMLMGGGDPMRYLDGYADRYWSFHVKDVVADRSSDSELGTGVLDLPKFLRAVHDLPQKPLYVEQEGATDELAAMRRDFDYLHGLNL
ncbi:MAG: TIM barrel protein, partial [bacterium]